MLVLRTAWVLSEDLLEFFPIFPPGFFPILSKLSFHKQFLFSKDREFGVLKGERLIMNHGPGRFLCSHLDSLLWEATRLV